MAAVKVVRTYLEMTSPDLLRGSPVPSPAPRIERLEECSVDLFRFLYREVGRAYYWTDRLRWTEAEIQRYLATAGVSIWLMSWQDSPAGYFELRQHEDGSVEIVYFGLLPDYVGRGWGKYLLTRAVQAAWALGANRVWLHTCTLDHPAALPNYIKRGFQPVRQEEYVISGAAGQLRRGAGGES
jgi:GNAT superfamily N-acetyltransferase